MNASNSFAIHLYPGFWWCIRWAFKRLFRPAYVGQCMTIKVYPGHYRTEGFDGVDYLSIGIENDSPSAVNEQGKENG